MDGMVTIGLDFYKTVFLAHEIAANGKGSDPAAADTRSIVFAAELG